MRNGVFLSISGPLVLLAIKRNFNNLWSIYTHESICQGMITEVGDQDDRHLHNHFLCNYRVI